MDNTVSTSNKFDRAGKIAGYILILFAAICAVAFVYLMFDLGRVWRGGNLVQSALLAISFVMFVVFVAGAFMRAELRVLLLLVAVSTLFGLYLFQGVFYLTTSGNARAKLAQSQGKPYDSRSKARFIEETNKDGDTVAPAATPTFWVDSDGLASSEKSIFPLSGLSGVHQVMCNEDGRWIKFRSDRYGFNNPDGVWDKKVQAVFIGDSFVHGACVDRNEDIAGSMRGLGLTAVNLGVTGNGPLIELATLREYGRKLKPKLVFWFYYEENDIRDLRHESASRTLLRYLQDDSYRQDLPSRQAEIDPAIESFIDSSRSPATSGLRKVAWALSFVQLGILGDWLFNSSNPLTRNRLFDAGEYKTELQQLEEILRKARQETESWGGKIAFVYLPRWSRYAHGESEASNLRLQVQEAAGRAGLPVYDFHRTLKAQKDALDYFPFRIDGHYTPEGNALLASELKSWAVKNNWIIR